MMSLHQSDPIVPAHSTLHPPPTSHHSLSPRRTAESKQERPTGEVDLLVRERAVERVLLRDAPGVAVERDAVKVLAVGLHLRSLRQHSRSPLHHGQGTHQLHRIRRGICASTHRLVRQPPVRRAAETRAPSQLCSYPMSFVPAKPFAFMSGRSAWPTWPISGALIRHVGYVPSLFCGSFCGVGQCGCGCGCERGCMRNDVRGRGTARVRCKRCERQEREQARGNAAGRTSAPGSRSHTPGSPSP